MMHVPPSSIVNEFRPIIERQMRSLNVDDVPMDAFAPAESEDDRFTPHQARHNPARFHLAGAPTQFTSGANTQDTFQSGAKAAMVGMVNSASIQGKAELPHVLLDAGKEEENKRKDERQQAAQNPYRLRV